MSVAAVTQPNPSNLFQLPASPAAGAQRLDTKVSAISAVADLTGRDRKSTRLNSSHSQQSRMPSSA